MTMKQLNKKIEKYEEEHKSDFEKNVQNKKNIDTIQKTTIHMENITSQKSVIEVMDMLCMKMIFKNK